MRKRATSSDAWSHPAIYWAAVGIGAFDLRNATWHSIKHRWESAMKKELEKKDWLGIPPALDALPAPGKCSLSAEEREKRLASLRAMLGNA